MRHNQARTRRRRGILLLAVSIAMLASAGTGLAGALVPLPTRKPDSVRLLLNAAPAPLPAAAAPLPPIKPARFKPVVLAPGLVVEDMASAAARDLAAIEPAAFNPAEGRAADVPAPARKPDSAEPDAEMLLRFGQPHMPQAKPLPHTTEALSDRDATLYRRIFAAQSAGEWQQADDAMRQLGDFRLRGHVLFQRYMHPSYKADFSELNAWMSLYADHPGADRLYRLAMNRKPAGFDGVVRKPRNQVGIGVGTLHARSARSEYSADKKRSAAQKKDLDRLIKAVNADISRGAPTKAAHRLNSDPAAKLMDPAEYDQLRGQIANGYLLMGKPAEARTLASASAGRSGTKAPMAGWAGGLAAWRQGDYKTAARLFEQTAKSPYVSTWMRAGGAYWASRAHMRAGNIKDVSTWLKEAAGYPHTFYGLIAIRALGWDFDFDWNVPSFDKGDFNKLVSIPAAWRAMALVQAGQNHLAEAELLQINPGTDEALKEALLAYTQEEHLPGLSMRLSNNFQRPGGGIYDAAAYPLLPWAPKGGYTLDRALIHAIARQESKFNTWAESGSGAMGLMQVLPSTAGYIMESRHFKDKDGKHRLTDPEINLQIGQKYVDHLLEMDDVDNDLLSVAIAYNAGPGNLRKWRRELAEIDDPLLFIEMIPMAETRNYVERVMANYWIYAIRLGQPLPSLDSVAEGRQASYVPMDDRGATIRLTEAIRPFRVADSGAE